MTFSFVGLEDGHVSYGAEDEQEEEDGGYGDINGNGGNAS